MRTIRTLCVCGLVCLALGAGAMSGCSVAPYLEGGDGVSHDQHVYVSTADQPKTVNLKDHRTDEVLWTVEVPVGQQLVVRFSNGYYADNPSFSDQMRWDLMPEGKAYGALNNEMAVPRSRTLDWSLRAPGEFPPENARKPVKQPDYVVKGD
ncbi:MAG: hypothetical protein AABZ53_00690 [Planctomycetota bacterium]